MQRRGPKNGIKSVAIDFAILEALKDHGEAGVTELADAVGTTKGTVHNHLSTLVHEEYVVKRGDKYRISLRFLDFARHARERLPAYDRITDEVDKLAEKSGEMVLFFVEEHGLGVCVYRALGEDAVTTPVYVGTRNTLHHTAVGKAILAHLPRERVAEIVDQRGLPAHTDHTIVDRDALFEELDRIADRGFAFNRGETIPGLHGVGFPILDPEGEVIGGISVIGPESRMGEDRLHGEIPDMLTRSVNLIELAATSQ